MQLPYPYNIIARMLCDRNFTVSVRECCSNVSTSAFVTWGQRKIVRAEEGCTV